MYHLWFSCAFRGALFIAYHFFLSLFLFVAISAEASDGPNVQPHIPKWIKNTVRLLQASKELANAHYLVCHN